MTLHDHPVRATATPAVELRAARPEDAEAIGRVGFAAFGDIHDRHGFPRDFPTPEAAIGLARAQTEDPRTFGVVALVDGRIVGSNFLTEGDPVRGVGPISVDPAYQGAGIGRLLMRAVIERGRSALGVRLLQDAFNPATMALYTALGFDPKEPLAVMTGVPRDLPPDDARVRPMTPADIRAVAALARRVHGFPRTADVQAALAQGTPLVLERGRRIGAYMTMPNFWVLNHAVAEDEAELRALILGAGAVTGQPLGLIVPIRRAALFRWCIDQGLAVLKPMTLMALGHYSEPDGAALPSVFY